MLNVQDYNQQPLTDRIVEQGVQGAGNDVQDRVLGPNNPEGQRRS